MNPTPLLLSALVVMTWLSSPAHGDGKMYGPVMELKGVPPEIPYQRAVILHADGQQTLILQSRYRQEAAPEVAELAWVVPVPAPPEFHEMSAVRAQQLFFQLMFYTATRSRSIRGALLMGVLFLTPSLAVALVACFLFCRCLKRSPPPWLGKKDSDLLWHALRVAAVFLLMAIFIPAASSSLGYGPSIDILDHRQVGVHEVKVVSATSADTLIEWLRSEGFAHDESDREAFARYIERGWVFVTAKLRPGADHDPREISVEGLAAPLVMTFPTEKPVYPLELTGTGGHDTEMVIYLGSDVSMDGDPRLPLRSRREFPKQYFRPIGNTDLSAFRHLARFQGTLKPSQMREDLVFHPNPDAADHQEIVWRW